MHYYQFNIGDYASHTRHLSLMENLAYRLLLDLYYLHERPLNACSTAVARQIGMRENVVEVNAVLEEFFLLTDDGWINKRADIEIVQYRKKLAQAAMAGKASAAKRTFNGRSTDVQPNKKQETRNINQEPVLKPKATSLPEWLQPEAWADFIQHRKAAKSAMTPRAQALALSELTKLRAEGHDPTEVIKQSIMRGWKGLFAIAKPFSTGQPYESEKDRSRRETYEAMTGSKKRESANTIDAFAERLD